MIRTALRAGSAFLLLCACVGDDPVASSEQNGGRQLGETCSDNALCASGACGDGVCCERACQGQCEECNPQGRCVPTTGTPKHGACTGESAGPCAGACDGTKTDACTYPAVECSAGSCAGGTATLPSMCKDGACTATTETQACVAGCFGETCLGVRDVAGGFNSVCALMTDTKVRCWGSNSRGIVDNGPGSLVVRRPQEKPGTDGAISIGMANGAACVAMSDGLVRCWGSNDAGVALGTGVTDALDHPAPTTMPGIAGATLVAGGSGSRMCAIVTGGEIKCWGSNGAGALGNGLINPAASSPVNVCAPGSTSTPCATVATGAVHVANGDSHSCAAFSDGKVACWGSTADGATGQTPAGNDPFPKYVAGIEGAMYVTAGNRLSCAVVAGGGVKCWGTNGTATLGNGTDFAAVPFSSMPVSVATAQAGMPILLGATKVSTFDESSCAVTGGAVKCWGTNSGGQLGDGSTTSKQNYAASTAIASGAINVFSAGTANYAIVVDRANQNLFCWGFNNDSKCGDDVGGPPQHLTPVSPKW